MNSRTLALQTWLQKYFGHAPELIALPGDASFRRYFRTQDQGQKYIIMDAPPQLEDCHGFIAIAKAYCAQQIRAPKIYAEDAKQGFILLEDFGDALLSTQLKTENAAELYHRCFDPLLRIQSVEHVSNWPLPRFDQSFMMRELNNFRKWFLKAFLQLSPEETWLKECFHQLTAFLEKQIYVGVHRDYHSRNLIVLNSPNIGILDFQDAVLGPISYDLVSLIRDCYVAWPQETVRNWLADFYSELPAAHKTGLEFFEHAFDWQGIQRHLKALFIFARKWCRDGSHNYLGDLPRTLQYVIDISDKYPELRQLHWFALETLKPLMEEKLAMIPNGKSKEPNS